MSRFTLARTRYVNAVLTGRVPGFQVIVVWPGDGEFWTTLDGIGDAPRYVSPAGRTSETVTPDASIVPVLLNVIA